LIVDSIIGQKLSVRDVEQMVKKMKSNDVQITTVHPRVEDLDFSELQSFFTSLGVKSSKKGSKLTLEFETNSQIDTFLSRLPR
jgi:ParB family chromosome partitioning protein